MHENKQDQGQIFFHCLCEFNTFCNYLLINQTNDKLIILHDTRYGLDARIVSNNSSLTTCTPLPEISEKGPLTFIDRLNILKLKLLIN